MLAERQLEKMPSDPAAPGKAGTSELPPPDRDPLERLRARMANEPNAKSPPASEPPGRTRERTRDPGRGR